jgi:mRNA interferase RelE/StbE
VADYRVELKSSARRELERLPNQVIRRLFARLENLAVNPRPPGCKKLKGGTNEWRIRVGDYRAVYTIDDGATIAIQAPLPTSHCLMS